MLKSLNPRLVITLCSAWAVVVLLSMLHRFFVCLSRSLLNQMSQPKNNSPLPQKPSMYDLCTVFTKKLQGNLGPKQAINPSKNSLNVLVLCFSGIKDVVVGLKQYFLANYGKQNR